MINWKGRKFARKMIVIPRFFNQSLSHWRWRPWRTPSRQTAHLGPVRSDIRRTSVGKIYLKNYCSGQTKWNLVYWKKWRKGERARGNFVPFFHYASPILFSKHRRDAQCARAFLTRRFTHEMSLHLTDTIFQYLECFS